MIKRPIFSILFDGLLFPLGKKSPACGILLASILTGSLILSSYHFFSKPEKNHLAKDRIKANILALRIYKDFPLVIFRSFLSSLGWTFRYLYLNIIPLLVPLPFLILLYIHMDLRFGFRPMKQNETFIIKARYSTDFGSNPVELLLQPTIQHCMNPVWIPKLSEIDWKVKAQTKRNTSLHFLVGDRSIYKQVVVGPNYCALPATIHTSKLLHFILGDEPPIPQYIGLSSISISYPRRLIRLGWIKTSWLIYYFILIVVMVMALKKRFKIEF